MRMASRENDSKTRWMLVGGIAVLVVIVTVVAIAGGFGFSAPKPTVSKTATPVRQKSSGCLFPRTVSQQAAILTPPSVPTYAGSAAAARRRLVTRLRLAGGTGANIIAWSPSNKRYLFTRGGHLFIGSTIGLSARRLAIGGYEDITFNGNGTAIIFEKRPQVTKFTCASVVLMTVGLGGKHRHLLFAGTYRLANTLPGRNGACCLEALQQDTLRNGWIVLVKGDQLFVFDPKQRSVAPLESFSLGPLYAGSGSAVQSVQQVSVSPNGRYLAVAGAGRSSFTIRQLPSSHVSYRFKAGLPVFWSPSGDRVAFLVLHTNRARTQRWTTIKTLDLAAGRKWTVRTSMKKFGPLTLGNIVWSRDGRYVAFTGTSAACGTGVCTGVHTFLSTWQGKHTHVLKGIGHAAGAVL